VLGVLVAGAELPDFGELGVESEEEPESDEPDEPDDSELEDFSALTLAELLLDSRLSVR
jgi:hypothetical protein